MRVMKLVLMVIDADNIGARAIKERIENCRDVYPQVKLSEIRYISDWSDDHPLNNIMTSDSEFEQLFSESSTNDKQSYSALSKASKIAYDELSLFRQIIRNMQ